VQPQPSRPELRPEACGGHDGEASEAYPGLSRGKRGEPDRRVGRDVASGSARAVVSTWCTIPGRTTYQQWGRAGRPQSRHLFADRTSTNTSAEGVRESPGASFVSNHQAMSTDPAEAANSRSTQCEPHDRSSSTPARSPRSSEWTSGSAADGGATAVTSGCRPASGSVAARRGVQISRPAVYATRGERASRMSEPAATAAPAQPRRERAATDQEVPRADDTAVDATPRSESHPPSRPAADVRFLSRRPAAPVNPSSPALSCGARPCAPQTCVVNGPFVRGLQRPGQAA